MFKINKLVLFSKENEAYTYEFTNGVNYFRGKNSSGKTEFYSFIDFMFGSSKDLSRENIYENSLSKASMEFEYNNINYIITRTQDVDINYIAYLDKEENAPICLDEYKKRLNSIFAIDVESLKNIRDFTEENLTYRTFTMFNFLGEKRQGQIQDFFDKCSEINYSIKLPAVLNFIFNKNLEDIYLLQNQLKELLEEIKSKEKSVAKYTFIQKEINNNLQKLNIHISYNGTNASQIREQLELLKTMENTKNVPSEKTLADLEVMYSNISEQIKVHRANIRELTKGKKISANRKKLLTTLQLLVADNSEFEYIIAPLESILHEIDGTISFSDYMISDKTVEELEKQRKNIAIEIKNRKNNFKMYSLEEKSKSVALIENYLNQDIANVEDELKVLKKKLSKLREQIKILQNTDDTSKINNISNYITELYSSAKSISSVVEDDLNNDGFKIKYIKKGNILQPVIKREFSEAETDDKDVNYYIGSMARHTLMQLCGYLAFLKVMLEEEKYPIIPILVIDHISKPFDEKNSNAIGTVISEAYKQIGEENLQIFMFDSKNHEDLSVLANTNVNLVNDNKTGFNPFFNPNL